MNTGRRAADLRLLLSSTASSAVVLGQGPVADAWRTGLAAAGVAPPGYGRPDLVVAGPDEADRAARLTADHVVVIGRSRARPLRAAGLTPQRVLVRPGADGPRLVLPLDRHTIAWASRTFSRGLLRPAALRAAGAVARTSTIGSTLLASRGPGLPALCRPALDAGVSAGASAALWLGGGDDLQRVVFHLLEPGSATASVVVKSSRVAGYRAPFERDAAGLSLAAANGPLTRAHVPALLVSADVGGHAVSVESAAPGRSLSDVLLERGNDALPSVLAIADWARALVRERPVGPDGMLAERDRLRRDVLPHFPQVSTELVGALPPLTGGLAHHDLGSWNILVTEQPGDFVVVDWESARRPALPLWDAVYLLTDALVTMQGPADSVVRAARAVELLAGRGRHGELLLRQVRANCAEAGVPLASAGPLVTLMWLHHACSHSLRTAAGGAVGRTPGHLGRIGPLWLVDERLGVRWPALTG